MDASSGSVAGESSRPAVSVVIPFRGDADDARGVVEAISALQTRPGDELIIVDNGSDSGDALAAAADDGVLIVAAPEVASSYYARNAGAERASCAWLLFLDSDCRPQPEVLDLYFAAEIPADWGAVAGDVMPAEEDSLLGGWAASRNILRQGGFERMARPAAVTANLLVRRDAWASVGGFLEGIRSGGDVDFCWRLQDVGWSLGYRPSASVRHDHRGTLRGLARQMARYGAGNAWLKRRYGQAPLRPQALRGVLRGIGGVVVWLIALQPRRAAYKAIDAVAIAAGRLGWLRSNGPPVDLSRGGGVLVMADCYARNTETFVANEVRELSRVGESVRVESIGRPERQLAGAAAFGPVSYVEDEGALSRIGSLLWLLARHPLRALADFIRRRTWDPRDRISLPALALVARRLARGGERHIHVHFATASSVSARRLARIRKIPYSVTAHGFDIWVDPRDLTEKLSPAAFVTSGCEYNVSHLRELVGSEAAARVHEVVMGVDPSAFRRSSPYPGGGTVVAVGRLVEKKGFAFLIEAAAEIDAGRLERVQIAGDGPLRAELEQLAKSHGLANRIEFLGSMGPDGIRKLLEASDLLVMPCVVAADGDRDSMPVVVKEAMAMEIPIVATDEVGLPEAIGPDRGRLAHPADSGSLAAAIEEVLGLPAQERAALGRAGREWVLRNATVELQAKKVLELIDSGATTRSS
jgi:colanic acid/amylovoran biosynthesis glycosyltransferase